MAEQDPVIVQGDVTQMMALMAQTGQRGAGGRLGYHLMDDAYYPSGTRRAPDIVRLLPQMYRQELLLNDQVVVGDWPFFTWREHRDTRTYKSTSCSGGLYFFDSNRAEPCHGCDLYLAARTKDERGRWKEGYLGRRQQHSVSLIHYHEYQLLPQLDKSTGQVKTRNDGSAFMAWQRSRRDPQAETLPCRKMRWDFGSTYRGIILDTAKAIFYSCKNCGTKNSIHWEAVVCGNPECEYPFYERGKTQLDAEEIEALDKQANEMYLCPHCEQTTLPKKYYACENCDDAQPASIFDVDLHFAMVETQTPGRKSTKTFQLVDYSEPHPIELPEGLTEEQAEFMLQPFDLPTLLGPTPMADQVAILGPKQVTRTPSNSTREYGQQR